MRWDRFEQTLARLPCCRSGVSSVPAWDTPSPMDVDQWSFTDRHLCHGKSDPQSQRWAQWMLGRLEAPGSFGQKLELPLLNPFGPCFRKKPKQTPKMEKLPPALGPAQSLGAAQCPPRGCLSSRVTTAPALQRPSSFAFCVAPL